MKGIWLFQSELKQQKKKSYKNKKKKIVQVRVIELYVYQFS